MNLTPYEWSLIVVSLLIVLACGLIGASARDPAPVESEDLYDRDGHLAERWRADAGGRR